MAVMTKSGVLVSYAGGLSFGFTLKCLDARFTAEDEEYANAIEKW